jgi:predicted DNA-binding transcriptional regulator AlpA
MTSDERLWKVNDVSRTLNVSRTWVYAAANDGRLPSIRLGGPDGPLRFVPEDVLAVVENARQAWRPGESSAATLRRVQSGEDTPS